MFATIDALAAAGAEVFVLSGSLPAGVAPTVYRDITERLTTRGRRVVLDTSGEALARAIEVAPNMIKPNIDELPNCSAILSMTSRRLSRRHAPSASAGLSGSSFPWAARALFS